MKLKHLIASIVVVLSLVAYKQYHDFATLKSIDSYESCASAKGSIIQESYPAICVTRLGSRFTQLIKSTMIENSTKDFSKDFSIQLSREWHKSNNKSPIEYFNYNIPQNGEFDSVKDKGKLKIEIYLKNGSDIDQIVDELRNNYPGNIKNSRLTLDGEPAILVEMEWLDNKLSKVITKNPTTEDIYSINFLLDFANYSALRDQILSTFKFTD